MLACGMRGLFMASSRNCKLQITSTNMQYAICNLQLDSFAKLAIKHLHIDLAQLGDRVDQMRGVAPERLLPFLGSRAHGVADHASVGELIVIHWELEILIALELHIRRAIGLFERRRQPA